MHGWPNRMHAEPALDGRWLATVAWRWAGRWLCGGGLPMGVAHRARASAGLDQHVMAASPSVVRPLWREGRPRSVGSKLAKKKNDEALWGDSAPVCGKVPAGYGLRYVDHLSESPVSRCLACRIVGKVKGEREIYAIALADFLFRVWWLSPPSAPCFLPFFA